MLRQAVLRQAVLCQAIFWKIVGHLKKNLPGPRQAVLRQALLENCWDIFFCKCFRQAVSRHVVLKQGVPSQTVLRQSSVNCRAVVRQSLNSYNNHLLTEDFDKLIGENFFV